MKDSDALKNVDRLEKLFVAANYPRGINLAKSARDCFCEMVAYRARAVAIAGDCAVATSRIETLTTAAEVALAESKRKPDEAAALRIKIAKLRRVVRDGQSLSRREVVSRLRFEEKVADLVKMAKKIEGKE